MHVRARAAIWALALIMCSLLLGGIAMGSTVEATLNGLHLTFDAKSGSIVEMSYPGPGTMLKAETDQASIIDLAYPIEKYEPLRLASRFSSDARITVKSDEVTVHWDKLGASRTWPNLTGKVGVTVRLKADPDGRSIVMTADIDNQSDISVRQVIFPDFFGIVPFAGVNGTIFKSCGFGRTPFLELQRNDARESIQFCMDVASYSGEYTSGGRFHSMWLRWFDFGGYNGGFSLFPKRWGWDPQTSVRVHHSETEEKLRVLEVHNIEVKPGDKWNSGEFVLTPHKSGWAKGIEVYREWARAHVKRITPLPKHVKEGIGFRTIWMSQGWPDDPQDAVFHTSDLPKLAREDIDHGLNEMVIWGWCIGFKLPLPGILPNLGTEREFTDAIAECKKIGVNVAPFISVVQAGKDTAGKYGLTVPNEGGWPQHTEMIPRFQAPYSSLYRCAQVDMNNQLWQSEVIDSVKHLVDTGIPSVSWDQVWNGAENQNMIELIKKIRAMATAKDPESTFSGEELWSLENDVNLLDYTWDWGGYMDCQAFNSVLEAPRMNCCISSDPWAVKAGFMDNLYLNIFPRKPGSVNGSDWIKSNPEFSRTLKQCAKLRAQFLPYFTDGRLIGGCILSEAAPSTRISTYVQPDRLLVLMMNEAGERKVSIKYDLEAWIKSPSRKYEMKSYDMDGNLLETKEITSRTRTLSTKSLKNGEIAAVEFIAQGR